MLNTYIGKDERPYFKARLINIDIKKIKMSMGQNRVQKWTLTYLDNWFLMKVHKRKNVFSTNSTGIINTSIHEHTHKNFNPYLTPHTKVDS